MAPPCPPLPTPMHIRWRLHPDSLIAERQAEKLGILTFIVFGLTQPGIEPKSTVSVVVALSTRPLIGLVEEVWILRIILRFI